MNLLISLKSELLKAKRSNVWISTFVMAAFVPIFLLLVFKQEHDGEPSSVIPTMAKDAWNHYFSQGRGMISIVFLPLFVVLMSTLLPQIEYRNHTWKQALAAPQSYGRVYFSKFLILQLFIIAFILIHCLFMGVSALISDVRNPKFNFSGNQLDWYLLVSDMAKTYIAIFALSTFQFWTGMRFKSFLVPIGVGVLCSILGMVNMIGYHVVDADKFFFTFSAFVFFKDNVTKVPAALWSSVFFASAFLVLGFLDFSRIKSR